MRRHTFKFAMNALCKVCSLGYKEIIGKPWQKTSMSIIARLHGLCSDDLPRIEIYVK